MQILAHRGLVSEFIPENTLAAFSFAVAAGVKIIETDIQCTKDAVPVVFHDVNLRRLSGIDKKVSACTLVELNEIDIGSGKRIPTLEQVLTTFPKIKFNLDLKSKESVAPTVAVIEKLEAHSQVLISSFSEKRRMQAMALLLASVRTSAGSTKVLKLYLCQKLGLRALFKKIAGGSSALQVPIRKGFMRFDSPGFISLTHESGLEIHFWTINEPKQMLNLAKLGADGIVTDRCDLAISTLR